MIIRKYPLSNIVHIEITLIRKKEWFRVRRGRGWYAMLEFKFKILNADHQNKIYSFKKIDYAPKRGSWDSTREKIFEKRSEFEKKIYSLKALFPEMISIIEKIEETPRLSIKYISGLIFRFSILFFALMFLFIIDPQRTILLVILLPIALLIALTFIKFKKYKEKKTHNNI